MSAAVCSWHPVRVGDAVPRRSIDGRDLPNPVRTARDWSVSERSQVLFIRGTFRRRKSAVAAEMSHQLAGADVPHCLIEGDNLDLAHPTPLEQGHPLTEMNLAAM